MTIPEKYTPYIFITFLCLVIGGFRLALIPEFPLYIHFLGFFLQLAVMSGIWQLIRFINTWLQRRFSLEKRPATQIVLQVAVTLCLLSPAVYLGYEISKSYLPAFIQGRVLLLISALFFMVILLMTFVYYTYTLLLEQRRLSEESTRLQVMAATLEKEKVEMRFHHLRNQVNPHFLFNTFSSLDGLIQTNPALASEFVRHLSRVYRYVLEHKEQQVVSLEREKNFINHYISLLSIRYGSALRINTRLSASSLEKGIAMVTLQMLIDNAIKHNSLQEASPLMIDITDDEGWLIVSNNKQLRRQLEATTRQGLQQLKELYQFLGDQPVEVTETDASFVVKIPLL